MDSFFEMSTFGHPGTAARLSPWRRLLILVAVLALGVSLVARYSSPARPNLGLTTSVSAQSIDGKTQHLLADGLQWTAPVVAFITFVVPRIAARAVEPALPIGSASSEHWLYNRPPPHFS